MRAINLTALLLALVLAGCGSDDQTGPLPATDTPSPTTASVTTGPSVPMTAAGADTTEAPTTSTPVATVSEEDFLDAVDMTEDEFLDALSQIPSCDGDRQVILDEGGCEDGDGTIRTSLIYSCDDGTEYRIFDDWYVIAGEIFDGEAPAVAEACGS